MPPQKKPNFLIIMTEHQQAATVEPGSPCRMPNVIERIAAPGIRFERAYTPCALCAPARASFFTGRYPTGHGMYNNYHSPPLMNADLFPDVRMFSDSLKKAGYALSYVGKWHISGTRTPADFSWHIVPDGDVYLSSAPDLRERRERWQRFKEGENPTDPAGLKDTVLLERPGWPEYALSGTHPGRLEDMTDYRRTAAAARELKRLAGSDQPWALYVGLIQIHDPYMPVEPYASMYDPRDVQLPASFHDDMADRPDIYRRLRRQIWSQLSEDHARQAIAAYWGLCTMTDDLVGMLLDALDDSGAAEDTLVLFCTDHGDQVGAHGLFLKGILPFEESYRVPMVARWPREVAPGSVCEEFVTHCDIAPTLCEIGGGVPLEAVAGRSILPLLKGEVPGDWPATFFGQFCGTEVYYTQRIVSDKRFKYVFNAFSFDELYDLEADPHEMKNLAQDASYEPVKKRLIGEFWRWVERSDDVLFESYPTVALVPYGPQTRA